MKKILLVVEGKTDYPIIKSAIESFSKERGEDVSIVELSPRRDATTGDYESSGWGDVKNWCKKNSIKTVSDPTNLIEVAAARFNWRSLLTMSSADLLIIHIDSDIAAKIRDTPYTLPMLGGVKEYCKQSIRYWLNATEEHNNLHPVAASHNIETWILATEDSTSIAFADLSAGFNIEHLTDIRDRMIKANLSTNKRVSTYNNHALLISEKINLVTERCEEVQHLREKILAL